MSGGGAAQTLRPEYQGLWVASKYQGRGRLVWAPGVEQAGGWLAGHFVDGPRMGPIASLGGARAAAWVSSSTAYSESPQPAVISSAGQRRSPVDVKSPLCIFHW